MPHAHKSTKSMKESLIKRSWVIVDVKNKILGRITNDIATLLQGKHKVDYAPYLDGGDYVVVINAKKVALSGKKAETKEYTYFSGYPGGLRSVDFKTQLEQKPEQVIRHAVSGKLPKNKLRDKRLARLYVYPDEKHPYENKIKI